MRRTAVVMICALVVIFSFGSALAQKVAQPPVDVMKVDYFDNANTNGAPDAKLRLSNPGTAGAGTCAFVYVFNPVQEISECCSCYLSPNGLRTLSVNLDLTSNPLAGETLITGSIVVVSNVATGLTCPRPTNITAASGGVRAWATHIETNGTDVFSITGSPSPDATMSKAEEMRLNGECGAIWLDTGGGICSCGTGD